jgi:hypothetical protein
MTIEELQKKNNLIGIPFKLNRRDFDGCDCRGICWLYFKYIKNKEYPFTDNGHVLFRNKKHDLKRMISVISEFSIPVEFKDLKEGDLLLLKTSNSIGSLAVCINDTQALHMDIIVGSCLTKLRYLEDLFLAGYRPNV